MVECKACVDYYSTALFFTSTKRCIVSYAYRYANTPGQNKAHLLETNNAFTTNSFDLVILADIPLTKFQLIPDIMRPCSVAPQQGHVWSRLCLRVARPTSSAPLRAKDFF